MIYADSELRDWWNRLSKLERSEVLDKVQEHARSPEYQAFVKGMRTRWELYGAISAKELQQVRRWVR
jgi:hypothetical protein